MEVENQQHFDESDENQNQLKKVDEVEEKIEVKEDSCDDNDDEEGIATDEKENVAEADQEAELENVDDEEEEPVTDLELDKKIEFENGTDGNQEEISSSNKEFDLEKENEEEEEIPLDSNVLDVEADTNKQTDLDDDDVDDDDVNNVADDDKDNMPELQSKSTSEDQNVDFKQPENQKDENDNGIDDRASPVEITKSDDLKPQENGKSATKPKSTTHSIKNSIAMFELPAKKDKGMFIAVQPDKCSACEKTVYAMEKLEMNKNIYHRGCFKCSHCSARLTANTFSINEGVIYCTTHFKQLFARKGNYDEGFGRQLYKKKWQEEQKRKQDASA